MDKRIRSLFSLSQKAGKLVTGEQGCEKALQRGTAKLVIVATDASLNTKKKFINKSFFYKVKAVEFGTKDEISQCIGKDNRSTFIIIEENFANKILELIEMETNTEMNN